LTKKKGMLASLLGFGSEPPAAFNEILDEDQAGQFLATLTSNGAVASGDPAVNEAAAVLEAAVTTSQQAAQQAAPAPAAFNLAESPEYLALKADSDAKAAKIAKLEADAEARRVADIEEKAATFAAKLAIDGVIFSAEYDDVKSDYIDAAEADHAKGGVVTFSGADGAEKQGSRVDKLAAKMARRPKHGQHEPSGLSGKPLKKGEEVLFSHTAPPDDATLTRKAADDLLAKSPEGQAILAKRNAQGR
jgi:hypothetical protein